MLIHHLVQSAKAAETVGKPFSISDLKFATTPATYEGLGGIISNVLNILLDVAGILAIIFTIYSGILYLTAAGNPDNTKKALQGLIYGAIGIAVIVLSRFIVETIMRYALTISTPIVK